MLSWPCQSLTPPGPREPVPPSPRLWPPDTPPCRRPYIYNKDKINTDWIQMTVPSNNFLQISYLLLCINDSLDRNKKNILWYLKVKLKFYWFGSSALMLTYKAQTKQIILTCTLITTVLYLFAKPILYLYTPTSPVLYLYTTTTPVLYLYTTTTHVLYLYTPTTPMLYL